MRLGRCSLYLTARDCIAAHTVIRENRDCIGGEAMSSEYKRCEIQATLPANYTSRQHCQCVHHPVLLCLLWGIFEKNRGRAGCWPPLFVREYGMTVWVSLHRRIKFRKSANYGSGQLRPKPRPLWPRSLCPWACKYIGLGACTCSYRWPQNCPEFSRFEKLIGLKIHVEFLQ